ncbi:helix-turn-helix domain-containing protein [Hymenobacter weizhouensis]|uniref:helix-turn-helix domain-containing protein n=1 Tax=Hymenobacter sp. YIM 151500-1 TaxID=2987689 RepID=UPI0022264D23|nr:hypothetical protein [Hymenobacter sp. YIM 151500-1]UYZ63961.1 hypothetical protein OIS53_03740 [Hymenobacter sp. YIM 151500-1]
MATTTVGQRIAQLIQQLGISKNAFAVSLDKTATVIQHLVEERNKPGFDLLCKIFEVYPNVSKDWLLQGQGPMLVDANPSASDAQATDSASVTPVKSTLNAARAAATPSTETPTPAESAPAPAPGSGPASVVAAKPAVSSEVSNSTSAGSTVTTLAPETVPMTAVSSAAPAPTTAPATPDTSWQAALYTQQMAHQLAMAELRNQHLQEQHRLMQQMMELMQKQLNR